MNPVSESFFLKSLLSCLPLPYPGALLSTAQDTGLDALAAVITRQKIMGQEIGNELDEQNGKVYSVCACPRINKHPDASQEMIGMVCCDVMSHHHNTNRVITKHTNTCVALNSQFQNK